MLFGVSGRLMVAVSTFKVWLGRRLASRLFREIFFQFLTRLEIRHAFGGHIHGFAGLGVPAASRASLTGPEAPKSTQLDFFPILEATDYRVEDRFHYDLGIAFVELRCACHFLYKLCFCHLFPLCRRIGSRFMGPSSLIADTDRFMATPILQPD
jgi:hypothetical protein